MTREEIIKYIKANDEHYARLTFEGYTNETLVSIKRSIENEKRKIENENILNKLPPLLAKNI